MTQHHGWLIKSCTTRDARKPKNDGMTYVSTNGYVISNKIFTTNSTIDVLDAKNHCNETLVPSTINMCPSLLMPNTVLIYTNINPTICH